MNKITILLVDDHDVVRTGVRKMLEMEDDIEVIGEVQNADDALAQLDHITPDVVLSDIKMPGMDGIELTRRLKQKLPDSRIIIFTLHGDYLTQAMQSGASGYLLKDIRRTELTSLIRQVLTGKIVTSANLHQSGQAGTGLTF